MSLSVQLVDFTGDRQATIEVPEGRTVAQVRPQVVEALGLDEGFFADDSDNATTWILYSDSDRQILGDSDRVGDVLKTGQSVRVVPNITAGSMRP